MPVMNGFENRTLASGVVTGRLLRNSPCLIFESADGTGIIRLWNADHGSPRMNADRHREAMFLQHPVLLRCLKTGLVEENGEEWSYALYERYEALLADLLAAGPASPAEAQDLAIGLTAPLEYLHGQNLVYCHLDPGTIARKNGRWVLCDYSQLRLGGMGYADETRRLLARIPGTPPEAFEGNVSPAWDAWSLAHVTRAALLGPRTRRFSNERLPRPELPEPFGTIINSCAAANPVSRCTVADIARQLEQHPPVATPAPAPEPEIQAAPPVRAAVSEPNAPPRMATTYRAAEAPDVHERRRGVPPMVWAIVALAAALALLFIVLGRDGRRKAGAGAATPTAAAPAAAQPAGEAEPSLPDATEPALSTRGRATDNSRVTENSDVTRVVRGWAEDFRQGDLASHLSYYAPRVDRIFRVTNVDRNYVRKVKEGALRPGSAVKRYELSDMRTEMQGEDRAVVTFDKTYEIAGASQNSGKVRSELRLRRTAEGWRIVSERDTKVYWQRRS
ncbi:MAG TPA: nuclear transport factor 2 family protein [Bryobacteraceae bacterium]|nr:nuclear transport factor 2 family protein [Bryobacteraceae bacterium]